jgi:hypothetical protein
MAVVYYGKKQLKNILRIIASLEESNKEKKNEKKLKR